MSLKVSTAAPTRGGKMKFIWYWQWKWEDYDLEMKQGEVMRKAIAENPKQFPKMLTNSCFTERGKGFRLIEAENEEQLMNLAFLWQNSENWKFEPYLEVGDATNKIWSKWHKP